MREFVLAISTCCYDGYQLPIALENISELGFDLVEIAAVSGFTEHIVPENMSLSDFRAIEKLMGQNALSSVSFSGHIDLGLQDSVKRFMKRIDFAEYIGAKTVNTFTTDYQNYASFVDNMALLAPYADRKGICIGLETDGGLVYTGKEGRDLLGRMNYPNVGINYDPGNVICLKPETIPERDIICAHDYLIHVHFKDIVKREGRWCFPGIGKGIVDFSALVRELISLDTVIPVSLELELNMTGTEDGFDVHARRPLDEINQEIVDSFDYLCTIFEKHGCRLSKKA